MDISSILPRNAHEQHVPEVVPLPDFSEVPDASWVDGGSAVLFTAPQLAVGVIKVARVRTVGKERAGMEVESLLVSIEKRGTRAIIRTLALASPLLDGRLDMAFDAGPVRPEDVIDEVRTLAERMLATGSDAIIDGSLRQDSLIGMPTVSAGLCKTSSLLPGCRMPEGVWQSTLVRSPVCATALRLHSRTRHVFVLETREDPDERLLGLLRFWSRDAAYPGYPYPLILADQLARVTQQEQESLRARLAMGGGLVSDPHAMLEHILYGKPFF